MPGFYIIGNNQRPPVGRKSIFTDGALFRSGRKQEGSAVAPTFVLERDVDLSHCLPNATPERFKADTSVEICMNYLDAATEEDWDWVVNDHLDMDGILSVFTLVHTEAALQHRDILIEAAAMGDFMAWGRVESQRIYHGITYHFNQFRRDQLNIQDMYARCLDRVMAILNGELSREEEAAIRTGMSAIDESIRKIDAGEAVRTAVHPRFVHYHIPEEQVRSPADLAKALTIPGINDPVDGSVWLYPQAKNKFDREKVQLVSITVKDGWYYDLWYPGYMWAETPNSWRAPGCEFDGETFRFHYAPLMEAVRHLNRLETAAGHWTVAAEMRADRSIEGRKFPVVMSFVTESPLPAPSRIPPDAACGMLAPLFTM